MSRDVMEKGQKTLFLSAVMIYLEINKNGYIVFFAKELL